MRTPDRQFGSVDSEGIPHLKERARALEPLGWKGRRAEWIALACFHGGVFTRVQWTSFLGSHHEKVGRAVRKLLAQGVAIEEKPPGIKGIGRICRIHGRPIYKALGLGDRRRRRITSPEVVMRRLLGLARRPGSWPARPGRASCRRARVGSPPVLRRGRGRAPAGALYRSYRTTPPTMVTSTRASANSPSGTVRMLRSMTATSPSLPTSSEPLYCSSKAAYALLIV